MGTPTSGTPMVSPAPSTVIRGPTWLSALVSPPPHPSHTSLHPGCPTRWPQPGAQGTRPWGEGLHSACPPPGPQLPAGWPRPPASFRRSAGSPNRPETLSERPEGLQRSAPPHTQPRAWPRTFRESPGLVGGTPARPGERTARARTAGSVSWAPSQGHSKAVARGMTEQATPVSPSAQACPPPCSPTSAGAAGHTWAGATPPRDASLTY